MSNSPSAFREAHRWQPEAEAEVEDDNDAPSAVELCVALLAAIGHRRPLGDL